MPVRQEACYEYYGDQGAVLRCEYLEGRNQQPKGKCFSIVSSAIFSSFQ
jgi:hypothetical protein